MAIYRLEAQIIGRSAGRSSVAAAAYRSGSLLVDERTGLTHDFRRKSGVRQGAILLPDGAPEWMADRGRLWNSVETTEKRKDAQLAREFVLAIPCELSEAGRLRLVTDFARELAAEGMVVDFSLHGGMRARNPHAHLMASLRRTTAEGWDPKKERAWNDQSMLLAQRERWAELCNQVLTSEHRCERVDHRSRAARGIAGPGQPKLGVAAAAMERRGEVTHRGEALRQWRIQWGAGLTAIASAWRQMTGPLTCKPAPLSAQTIIPARAWFAQRPSLDEVDAWAPLPGRSLPKEPNHVVTHAPGPDGPTLDVTGPTPGTGRLEPDPRDPLVEHRRSR